MRLVSLNVWGGCLEQALLHFFGLHQDVDVFCLQEVYHKASHKISTCEHKLSLCLFDKIQSILSQHQGYFLPVVGNGYGIAIFIKNSINVISHEYCSIHENTHYKGRGPDHGRSMQWLRCDVEGVPFRVFNVHGLWNGQGKGDSLERIEQSKRINQALSLENTPALLVGDLNLRPETESLRALAPGYQNLIDEYGVHSTRTSFYPKKERYADYAFASPQVHIDGFEVLGEEVSDHAPLHVIFHLR